jgi:hypothetical protein
VAAGRINLGDLILAIARTPGALKRRAEERRHRKRMRKAPRFALADFPENTFGKVVGIARPLNKRLIEAPLSGRLCVYYEAYVDSMVEGSMLRTLASEQEGMAFVLEDDGCRAIVDPTNAFMSTGIDFTSTSTLGLTDDRQTAMLRRHGLAGTPVQFADGLRYREAIIEADERIAVFGAGIHEPDRDDAGAPRAAEQSELGYRGEGARTRLRLSGTSRFPLFISDDPRVL